MSEETFEPTELGWELDSVRFENRIAEIVGCELEYSNFGTHFVFKDHQLGGWTFEGIQDAIEHGYSNSFCKKLLNALLNKKVEIIKS